MSRKTLFAPGEYYHIYNRGVDKRDVFTDHSDYERFVALLYLCNGSVVVNTREQGQHLEDALTIERGDPLIDIVAYCLMPNHFHLLIREKSGTGISQFMQKFSTGYTMYFNGRLGRSGSLFQGPYRATHADNDRYLSYLIPYIHLNPAKLIDPKWKECGISDHAKAEKFLEQYVYSSYLDYLGNQRDENNIVNMRALPRYYQAPADFRENVREWLSYRDTKA